MPVPAPAAPPPLDLLPHEALQGASPEVTGVYQANRAKDQALHSILAATALSLAGGAGLRALTGSRYLFGSSVEPAQKGTGTNVVQVPYPVYANRREEQKTKRRLGILDGGPLKTAASNWQPWASNYIQGQDQLRPYHGLGMDEAIAAPARQHLDRHFAANEGGFLAQPLAGDSHAAGTFSGGHLRGDTATSPAQVPWFFPGMGAGILGGLYGGHTAMDWFLEGRRKQDLQGEVEQARREYQKALLDQYPPQEVQPALKRAAAPSVGEQLGRELDRLYDLSEAKVHARGLCKEADWTGPMIGAGGLMALLLGLGSGKLMYDYARKRSMPELLQKAVERRESERMQRRPPFIQAVPVPVTYRGGKLNPVDPDQLGREDMTPLSG